MTDHVIWVEKARLALPERGHRRPERRWCWSSTATWTLTANAVVNGLVFVTGNITGNGSPTIYGSLISAGSANVTGNPKVIYDPKVLGAAVEPGQGRQAARHAGATGE